VTESLKDQRRRERLREYEAQLAAARSALQVLALFVHGREARTAGEPLEEYFAGAGDSLPDDDTSAGPGFPAAVWVALRQHDVEAALELLLALSADDFVVAAHEQLDAGYRLTAVEEKRALPDVSGLRAQVSSFIRVPDDVIAMISGWGADDPRSSAEIDALLEQRFGPANAHTDRPPNAPTAVTTPARVDPPGKRREMRAAATPAQRGTTTPSADLSMSADEFIALINLSPDQQRVLALLVRQATITIYAEG
jgi:hypothetical protein